MFVTESVAESIAEPTALLNDYSGIQLFLFLLSYSASSNL